MLTLSFKRGTLWLIPLVSWWAFKTMSLCVSNSVQVFLWLLTGPSFILKKVWLRQKDPTDWICSEFKPSFRWMNCWMVEPSAKHCRKRDEAVGYTVIKKNGVTRSHTVFQHVHMQMKKVSSNFKWRCCEGRTCLHTGCIFFCRGQQSPPHVCLNPTFICYQLYF